MNREEIINQGLQCLNTYKCIIAQLPTGYGKTQFAIKLTNEICKKENLSILILVAKSVHKQTWTDEINKWGGITSNNIIIECYESLHKYKDKTLDIIICDEAQHLSELRRDILKTININYNIICLSATLPGDVEWFLENTYKTKNIIATLQDAIDVNILPDPMIYTIPLEFDNDITECIGRNTGKGLPIVYCKYEDRWYYIKRKDIELQIKCTKQQYLDDLNSQIEWYKSKTMQGMDWARFRWLKLCNDRLKWLAKCKNEYIATLLDKFKNYRTLTFCASIEQANILGKNCIHSKNKLSQKVLDDFNNKKIKHITACNILNEGVNLTDCRIGIFANLNASEIMVVQRIGRVLRHKHPIIIMPYFRNTREEELVEYHLEEYNSELVKEINDLNEIEL